MKENILDIIKLRPISLLEIIKNNDIDKEIDTELILYKISGWTKSTVLYVPISTSCCKCISKPYQEF